MAHAGLLALAAAAAAASAADARAIAASTVSQAQLLQQTAGPLPPCRECSNGCVVNHWREAALEEGLDLDGISLFGRTLPKVRRSEVEKLRLMSHEKVRDFNFQGRLNQTGESNPYNQRRAWVVPFALEHFGSRDYLSVRDADEHAWERLGPFDHSGEIPTGHASIHLIHSNMSPGYLEVMASSKYTLCPSGDCDYSWRVVEAIAAGSLPVIKLPKEDYAFDGAHMSFGDVLQAVMLKMHYVLLDEVLLGEYRQSLVEENWRTFVRYFTFMEGDNELPGFQPCLCTLEETPDPICSNDTVFESLQRP